MILESGYRLAEALQGQSDKGVRWAAVLLRRSKFAAIAGSVLLVASGISAHTLPASATHTPARADETSIEAKSIVSELLSRSPPTNEVFVGSLVLRKQDVTRLLRPVLHRVRATEAGWEDTWEAAPTEKFEWERLIVRHNGAAPNRYHYWKSLRANGAPAELAGEMTAIPFADSEFWICDLGLDFLHWPKQIIVKARATTGLQRPCRVIESSTNSPSKQGYAKVVSWLDIETGAFLRAEAFDSGGRRVKRFEVRVFRRNGSADFDMWNDRQDTKSSLQFRPDL